MVLQRPTWAASATASGRRTWRKTICSHDLLTLLQRPAWVVGTAASSRRAWRPFVVVAPNWWSSDVQLGQPVWLQVIGGLKGRPFVVVTPNRAPSARSLGSQHDYKCRRTWGSICICGWWLDLLACMGGLHHPKVAQGVGNSLAPKVCVLTDPLLFMSPLCFACPRLTALDNFVY